MKVLSTAGHLASNATDPYPLIGRTSSESCLPEPCVVYTRQNWLYRRTRHTKRFAKRFICLEEGILYSFLKAPPLYGRCVDKSLATCFWDLRGSQVVACKLQSSKNFYTWNVRVRNNENLSFHPQWTPKFASHTKSTQPLGGNTHRSETTHEADTTDENRIESFKGNRDALHTQVKPKEDSRIASTDKWVEEIYFGADDLAVAEDWILLMSLMGSYGSLDRSPLQIPRFSSGSRFEGLPWYLYGLPFIPHPDPQITSNDQCNFIELRFLKAANLCFHTQSKLFAVIEFQSNLVSCPLYLHMRVLKEVLVSHQPDMDKAPLQSARADPNILQRWLNRQRGSTSKPPIALHLIDFQKMSLRIPIIEQHYRKDMVLHLYTLANEYLGSCVIPSNSIGAFGHEMGWYSIQQQNRHPLPLMKKFVAGDANKMNEVEQLKLSLYWPKIVVSYVHPPAELYDKIVLKQFGANSSLPVATLLQQLKRTSKLKQRLESLQHEVDKVLDFHNFGLSLLWLLYGALGVFYLTDRLLGVIIFPILLITFWSHEITVKELRRRVFDFPILLFYFSYKSVTRAFLHRRLNPYKYLLSVPCDVLSCIKCPIGSISASKRKKGANSEPRDERHRFYGELQALLYSKSVDRLPPQIISLSKHPLIYLQCLWNALYLAGMGNFSDIEVLEQYMVLEEDDKSNLLQQVVEEAFMEAPDETPVPFVPLFEDTDEAPMAPQAVEVWENERRRLGGIFDSCNLYLSEREKWSTADGLAVEAPVDMSLWVKEVDEKTDALGWMYASHWRSSWQNRNRSWTIVRRRRWLSKPVVTKEVDASRGGLVKDDGWTVACGYKRGPWVCSSSMEVVPSVEGCLSSVDCRAVSAGDIRKEGVEGLLGASCVRDGGTKGVEHRLMLASFSGQCPLNPEKRVTESILSQLRSLGPRRRVRLQRQKSASDIPQYCLEAEAVGEAMRRRPAFEECVGLGRLTDNEKGPMGGTVRASSYVVEAKRPLGGWEEWPLPLEEVLCGNSEETDTNGLGLGEIDRLFESTGFELLKKAEWPLPHGVSCKAVLDIPIVDGGGRTLNPNAYTDEAVPPLRDLEPPPSECHWRHWFTQLKEHRLRFTEALEFGDEAIEPFESDLLKASPPFEDTGGVIPKRPVDMEEENEFEADVGIGGVRAEAGMAKRFLRFYKDTRENAVKVTSFLWEWNTWIERCTNLFTWKDKVVSMIHFSLLIIINISAFLVHSKYFLLLQILTLFRRGYHRSMWNHLANECTARHIRSCIAELETSAYPFCNLSAEDTEKLRLSIKRRLSVTLSPKAIQEALDASDLADLVQRECRALSRIPTWQKMDWLSNFVNHSPIDASIYLQRDSEEFEAIGATDE